MIYFSQKVFNINSQLNGEFWKQHPGLENLRNNFIKKSKYVSRNLKFYFFEIVLKKILYNLNLFN